MESLLIKGGVPLHGEVTISGAKNAVLPIMAATLLTSEPCVIRHVPNLSDVKFMGQILEWLGATVKFEGDTVHIHAKKIKGSGDYELVRKMRGSICIMGPLLGRLKKATVSLPGGCVIGARPINLHLKGFEALGAKIKIESGYVEASAKKMLGAPTFLGARAGSTVLGTGNVMMAATLAEGVTIIEAATYAMAAAATNGEVTLRGARADHMHAVLDKLHDSGVKIERKGSGITVSRNGKLKPVDVTTLPYSGFPTDVQAQMMALMT